MEKILIDKKEKDIELWKESRLELNNLVNELLGEFQNFGVQLGSELFVKFIDQGNEMVYGLLEKQVQKEIKNMPNVYNILKGNFEKEISEQIEPFIISQEQIKIALNKCGMTAGEVLITNGKSILSKGELEKKRESLNTYIETPDQLELWKILQKGSDFFNELEVFLKKHKLISIFKMGSPKNLEDYIIFEKDPKFEIPEPQQNLGFMSPMSGGMISLPNYWAVKTLK